MSNTEKNNKGIGLAVMIALNVLLVAAIGIMIWLCVSIMNGDTDNIPEFLAFETQPIATAAPETEPVETVETEPEETVPPTTQPLQEPAHAVSSATIGAAGDLLLTMPILNAAEQADGSYNFDPIFWYLSEYSYFADYAVISLETTLAGTDSGYRYNGFTQFNAPDAIVDSVKNAGFDLMLTANEHCYDTRRVGLLRTIETIENRGMEALGTFADANAPKYTIVEANGIPVGMLNYTFETSNPGAGYASGKYLNGMLMYQEDAGRVASFLPENLEPFYNEVRISMAELRALGVDATVLFLHWGEEYKLKPADYQKNMAQRLCDLGVDVIIGTHPHVVQPVEVLTSTVDPAHQTVCMYSLGNSMSNQRIGTVARIGTPHTEDGVWFTCTFSQYSDGKVYLETVDAVPTWVDVNAGISRMYHILPLDENRREDWKLMYSLSDEDHEAVTKSWKRTNSIIGTGIAEAKAVLAVAKEQRDADYVAQWLS